ncbi:MAG: aminotransferase class V-fold PLP-dependent enzyme, partial [bacterium]
AGTTASINLVARSWGDSNLKPGDEIVLTEMEHHSNIVPWQQLAERTGAVIRWLAVGDDYQLDIDSLDQVLGASTKLVAVTAVSNVLGTINPVRTIVDAAHRFVTAGYHHRVGHAHAEIDALMNFETIKGHRQLAGYH